MQTSIIPGTLLLNVSRKSPVLVPSSPIFDLIRPSNQASNAFLLFSFGSILKWSPGFFLGVAVAGGLPSAPSIVSGGADSSEDVAGTGGSGASGIRLIASLSFLRSSGL